MTQENQETQETQALEPTTHPLAGLKVVLDFHDGGVLVGVRRGDPDPHVESFRMTPEEGLDDVLSRVPQVVERAQARWEEQAQFPRYQAPVAAPASTGGQTGTRRQGGNTRTNQQQDVQTPRMF